MVSTFFPIAKGYTKFVKKQVTVVKYHLLKKTALNICIYIYTYAWIVIYICIVSFYRVWCF